MTKTSTAVSPLEEMGIVKTAGGWRTNREMVAEALELHGPGPGAIILDMTYGRGRWWPKNRSEHPAGLVTNDLDPDLGADMTHDFTRFPVGLGPYDVVCFDPAYVARGGRTTDGSFRPLNEAYGLVKAPRTPEGMFGYNLLGLHSCYTVTKPGGLILMKCSDFTSGGERQWHREDYSVYARKEMGLVKEDELLMVNHGRPQPMNGRTQRRSHNNTSALLVFRKPKRTQDLPELPFGDA